MIKSHNKLGTEGNFPNLKEGHSPKGHHSERLNDFSLRLRTQKDIHSCLFNIIQKILTNATRQGRKRHMEWKGRNETVSINNQHNCLYGKFY